LSIVAIAGLVAAPFSVLVYVLNMIAISIFEQDEDNGMLFWIVMDGLYFAFFPLVLSYAIFGLYAKIRRNLGGGSSEEKSESSKTKIATDTTGEFVLSSTLTSSTG